MAESLLNTEYSRATGGWWYAALALELALQPFFRITLLVRSLIPSLCWERFLVVRLVCLDGHSPSHVSPSL